MVSYLFVTDWLMRKALEERNTGIRWRFTEKVEDLDFVDDLALLSSAKWQFQLKTDRLFNASQETGSKDQHCQNESNGIHCCKR